MEPEHWDCTKSIELGQLAARVQVPSVKVQTSNLTFFFDSLILPVANYQIIMLEVPQTSRTCLVSKSASLWDRLCDAQRQGFLTRQEGLVDLVDAVFQRRGLPAPKQAAQLSFYILYIFSVYS